MKPMRSLTPVLPQPAEATGFVEPLSDLPIECERDYGTARGYFEFPDFFCNSVVPGPNRTYRFLCPEQFGDFILPYFGTVSDDLPHARLIRKNAV